MIKFNPDYSKCNDSRKEVYHNVCRHMIKNDIMLCTIPNTHMPCIAWIGYKHNDNK